MTKVKKEQSTTNADRLIRINSERQIKSAVKKDRRTKAELIKQIDHLLNQRIHPAVVLSADTENFDAGYKAGVKAQQEWYAEHPWWAFWR
jgi:hypothetical protein